MGAIQTSLTRSNRVMGRAPGEVSCGTLTVKQKQDQDPPDSGSGGGDTGSDTGDSTGDTGGSTGETGGTGGGTGTTPTQQFPGPVVAGIPAVLLAGGAGLLLLLIALDAFLI